MKKYFWEYLSSIYVFLISFNTNVLRLFWLVGVAVVIPRLNFSTAWSTNTVSICQSAGLTNVTRVELSRRFLIKVYKHTHTHTPADANFSCELTQNQVPSSRPPFWWDPFLSPAAEEWREPDGARRRRTEADWVSVWQYDRVHLSASHHLLHSGRQAAAGVRGGHPGEGTRSLGGGQQWPGWDPRPVI